MKFSILLVIISIVVCPSTANGHFDELNKLVKRWIPGDDTSGNVLIQIKEYRDWPFVDLNELFSRNTFDDVVTVENFTVKVPRLYQYLSALYVFNFERILATMLSFYMFVFENNWYDHPARSRVKFFEIWDACHEVFLRMNDTLVFFNQFIFGQVTFLGNPLTNHIKRALNHMLNVSDADDQTDYVRIMNHRVALSTAHYLVTRFYKNNMMQVPDYIYDAGNNSKALLFATDFLDQTRALDSKFNTITSVIDESLTNIKTMYMDLGFCFDESHVISIFPLPLQNTFFSPPYSDEDEE